MLHHHGFGYSVPPHIPISISTMTTGSTVGQERFHCLSGMSVGLRFYDSKGGWNAEDGLSMPSWAQKFGRRNLIQAIHLSDRKNKADCSGVVKDN